MYGFLLQEMIKRSEMFLNVSYTTIIGLQYVKSQDKLNN